MTSQTFYGLSMHWARYCGMFELDTKNDDVLSLVGNESIERKTYAWKLWVGKETQLRILLGLYVIDGVVSQFSGNGSGTSWPTTNCLPLPASEEVFNAPCPDKWLQSMTAVEGRRPSVRFFDLCHQLFPSMKGGHAGYRGAILDYELELFDLKVVLEILNSLATASSQVDASPVGFPSKLEIARALCVMRRHILHNNRISATDRSIALLRWHSICLDTITSTARGARRMCYQFGITQHIFGGAKRPESGISPAGWVQSLAGRKCLLHSVAIQEIASQMPLGVAHDVYLAGGLFAAAATYSSFALAAAVKTTIPSSIDWDAVLMSGFEELSLNGAGPESTRNTVQFVRGVLDPHGSDREIHNLSYDLTSIKILLRGMSLQWGVAREMEEVVDAWTQHCVG
jgi:hypothetical protein